MRQKTPAWKHLRQQHHQPIQDVLAAPEMTLAGVAAYTEVAPQTLQPEKDSGERRQNTVCLGGNLTPKLHTVPFATHSLAYLYASIIAGKLEKTARFLCLVFRDSLTSWYRKCGRVVCNSCSPHRIIIPHQYIVRQPGYEMPYAPSFFMDNMGGGYWEAGRMPGGERVRLCNPCVPDPNTEPPLSPSPRSPHQRSRSSFGSSYGAAADTGRSPGFVNALPGVDASQYQSSRSRSITMVSLDARDIPFTAWDELTGIQQGPGGQGAQFGPAGTRSASYQTPLERYMRPPSASNRRSLYGSSSRQRALPPTPQIPEEDECPVCHRELPQRALLNYEALREAHITSCIQSHSTYGSPRGVVPEGRLPVPPRRSGMYTYPATEKDCVDDAECTICLEEFTVGVGMARLECLCRFHRTCIAAWFVNHPGRCPVHQHDGFGY